MNADLLLERIAATLKRDIGPAIEAEYPKTQAFMAGVVLQKLGRQLGLAEAHRAADAADRRALIGELRAQATAAPVPPAVQSAIDSLAADPGDAALCTLIGALYQARGALGAARFDALLVRVRKTLRANIDRRMEFAA
jgi:thioredoxin-like negative regulator of GroEL